MFYNILEHGSTKLLALLFSFMWIDTGSSIIGKVAGFLLFLYAIGSLKKPSLLISDELLPLMKDVYRRFGGYIILVLSIITTTNLHTKNSVMEGITLLIVFVPILILILLNKTYSIENRRKWLGTISIVVLFILISLSLIIWPEPPETDIFDIIFYIGIFREIIREGKK